MGNTANWTLADWKSDISIAKSSHIDAFALNIAAGEPANDIALPMAFTAADSLGFGLFFSFDYAGNGPWHAKKVIALVHEYASHKSYFHYQGQPLVSTFEGTDNADDWWIIKAVTECFFIPDWSSLGAKEALEPGVADGLFSWAAWPWGDRKMNTYTDASYLRYLDGKPYMMPVSPWFFTNLPGYGKNWQWYNGHLWFDRWQEVISLKPLPEFVQIISWNDYGESHYIAPIRDNSMVAFDIGRAPFNYALEMPHDGWRIFLPYLIDTYKNGIATVTQEGLQVWYRRTHTEACSSGGTSVNTASQLQLEFWPSDVLEDQIFFSALLTEPADVSVTINGRSVSSKWLSTPEGGIGIYHGTALVLDLTGEVTVKISRAQHVVVSVSGAAISDSCTGEVQNYNA